MTDLLGPRAGRRLTNLRASLCEQQRYRCAVCVTPLNYPAYSDDPKRPCLAKIDREREHGRKNSVVTCSKCAGSSTAFPSLLAYYESLHNGSPKKKKVKIVYPETVPEINRQVAVRLAELGFPNLSLRAANNFRYAPPEAIPNIVETRIKQAVIQFEKSPGAKRKNYLTVKKWRERFSEAQNHRCCYCGVRFSDHIKHPRYSSWEHVVALRNDGEDHHRNLVLACVACNTLRDAMDLSAYDYYEWAQTHLAEIEGKAMNGLYKRRRFNLRPAQYELDIFGTAA